MVAAVLPDGDEKLRLLHEAKRNATMLQRLRAQREMLAMQLASQRMRFVALVDEPNGSEPKERQRPSSYIASVGTPDDASTRTRYAQLEGTR